MRRVLRRKSGRGGDFLVGAKREEGRGGGSSCHKYISFAICLFEVSSFWEAGGGDLGEKSFFLLLLLLLLLVRVPLLSSSPSSFSFEPISFGWKWRCSKTGFFSSSPLSPPPLQPSYCSFAKNFAQPSIPLPLHLFCSSRIPPPKKLPFLPPSNDTC